MFEEKNHGNSSLGTLWELLFPLGIPQKSSKIQKKSPVMMFIFPFRQGSS